MKKYNPYMKCNRYIKANRLFAKYPKHKINSKGLGFRGGSVCMRMY